MSTLVLPAAPAPPGRSPAPAARRRGVRRTAPAAAGLVPDLAFAAFAVYGALRWGELLSPVPAGRLLALAALGTGAAAAGRRLAGTARWLLIPLALLALAAVLAISGWPLHLIAQLRHGALVRGIGAGISHVPQSLVPYKGADANLRRVLIAGAGGLLLAAALLPALLPRQATLAARLPGAVALLTLAVVPATLMHPRLPDLEGLLLLGLLAGYLWAGRLPERAGLAAAVLVTLAGVAAVPLAGWLRQPTAWINPEGLGGAPQPQVLARFDWRQSYGPLRWPRNGLEVLEVQAAHPEYWKAENLDVFDGRTWAAGPTAAAPGSDSVAPGRRRRWTQTLSITVGSLAGADVVAAGSASRPARVPGLSPGTSPGTWVAARGLAPGQSYRVSVYDPAPSATVLARIPAEPAATLPAERTITLPASGIGTPGPLVLPTAQLTFPAFGTGESPSAPGLSVAAARRTLMGSPYAPVYVLAQRLRAGARTPYAYLAAILRLLGRGYRYDETPPQTTHPLVDFLLRTRAGYCQHFAGAMALLLRMGGVPARVSAGFTSGQKDASTGAWLVEDYDAHAWVEAWFPGWGWVTFDPTPGAAPERHYSTPIGPGATGSASQQHQASAASPRPRTPRTAGGAPGSPAARNLPAGRSDGPLPRLAVALLLVGLLLVAGALLRLTVRLHPPSQSELVDELERAHRRLRRPLRPGTTLAALEALLRDAPEAAGYVGTLRELRYAHPGAPTAPPTRRQRRALRRRLRGVDGRGGRLRGLWALPPQWVLLH